ncbi:uncharacterized protein I303_106992 [Kwoniella dejecticola CBS 10117]|uniref:Glutathione S-transferase n=1 Tax=Kwoniella dejecticola CBS 10117 TaxID=1296121 RepID=A0A1A5ZYE8_9TREE|nr:glutathione S-transferase [Kwoniella dejecticola CBS 10117]OBR82836.1 glutathione S-transferase [Kwoniella dejecticola CBS 10117]
MSSEPFQPVQRPETFSDTSLVPKLHLYTVGTPNGFKPSILLEELHAAYPEDKRLVYDFVPIRFSEKDQKKPEFLKINPNGRIPALIDDNAGGHNVWESASILLWLIDQYDPEHKFTFTDPKLKSVILSWIFFAHGGVGPMQGQANHFARYAPEKIEYGIKRYQDETSRLYSVLEGQLKKPENNGWLVGGKYTVADINVFPWVRGYAWAGIDISPFPALKKWLDTIEARPAVYAGLGVPARAKKLTKEEEEQKAAESRKNFGFGK